MNQHSNLGHISASYVNLLFDWLAETHPDVAQTNPFARPVAGELNRIEVPQWQAMLQWTYQTLQDPACAPSSRVIVRSKRLISAPAGAFLSTV